MCCILSCREPVGLQVGEATKMVRIDAVRNAEKPATAPLLMK
jgi:hypothetical protein